MSGEPYSGRVINAELEDGSFEITFGNLEPLDNIDREILVTFMSLDIGKTSDDVSEDNTRIEEFVIILLAGVDDAYRYTLDMSQMMEYMEAMDTGDDSTYESLENEVLASYEQIE